MLATDDWSAVQSVIEEYRGGVIWDDYLHVLDASTGQVVVALGRRDSWHHGNAVTVEDDMERFEAEFQERQK